MAATNLRAMAPMYEDPEPTDARLVARAMSLHEQFMKARPSASLPTRIDVMRDRRDGGAEVCMYDANDVLVAVYLWDRGTDNMRKVVKHEPTSSLRTIGMALELEVEKRILADRSLAFRLLSAARIYLPHRESAPCPPRSA